MPRRFISLVLTVACILLAVAIIHRGAEPVQMFVPPRVSSLFEQSFVEEEALLDQPVKALPLDDVTLQEAIDVLADLTKINFVINWKALEAEGISPDEQNRITLHLRNVKLRQALEALTHDTNAGGPLPSLGYYVSNGVVFITTANDAAKVFETAFMDLRPLIQDVRANHARSWFGNAPPATHQEIIDDIVKYILDVVDDGWRDSSGFASLREIEGVLVVTQKPDNIRSIRVLLDQLHAAIVSGTPWPATRPTTAPTQRSGSQ